jgi:serine/threonine-protein kinase
VVRVRRPGVSDPAVSAQEPAAGTRLYKGASVDVVVAEPAPAALLRMPDLRGAPLYKARQAIAAAGFVLGPVTYERTGAQVPNTILRQSPAPGGRIHKGEQLELVVASR